MRSQALIKPYFKYIFNFFEKILIFSKKILKLQEIKTIRRKSQSEPE